MRFEEVRFPEVLIVLLLLFLSFIQYDMNQKLLPSNSSGVDSVIDEMPAYNWDQRFADKSNPGGWRRNVSYSIGDWNDPPPSLTETAKLEGRVASLEKAVASIQEEIKTNKAKSVAADFNSSEPEANVSEETTVGPWLFTSGSTSLSPVIRTRTRTFKSEPVSYGSTRSVQSFNLRPSGGLLSRLRQPRQVVKTRTCGPEGCF